VEVREKGRKNYFIKKLTGKKKEKEEMGQGLLLPARR